MPRSAHGSVADKVRKVRRDNMMHILFDRLIRLPKFHGAALFILNS